MKAKPLIIREKVTFLGSMKKRKLVELISWLKKIKQTLISLISF